MAYSSGTDFSKPAPLQDIENVFNQHLERWKEVRRTSMGYQRNWIVHPYVQRMMKLVDEYGVHNLGDWRAGSRFEPNAMAMEAEVMAFFFELFRCPGGPENYWGYIDACGSSGNHWCITVGKEALRKATGKSPIMIFSKAAHYSVDTGGMMCSLPKRPVEERKDGSIDMDDLKKAFEEDTSRPILMIIVCGGTVVNGRDSIRDVLDAAKATGRPRKDFFFHVDAALRGVPDALMNDPLDAGKIPDFSLDVGGAFDIDSVATSTHKFIGTLDTGGAMVMKRCHIDALAESVEYIQSLNNTQNCSRNARAIIECWLLLKYLGSDVLRQWASACAVRARQMKEELEKAGAEGVTLVHNSSIIHCEEFCPSLSKKFLLAPKAGYIHIVVAPHTLHPSELGLDRDGKPFEGYDTATRFMEAALKALQDRRK